MLELEQEFEEYKALHKYAILKAKIMNYYSDSQDTEINIPDFLREDTPEKLADKDLQELLSTRSGIEKFNKLYEMAWQEIAPCLE